MNKGIEKAKREGGKCLRCGADEFRINGYCSCECEDLAYYEAEIATAKAALERIARFGITSAESRIAREALDKID